jgi:hypothetical protein
MITATANSRFDTARTISIQLVLEKKRPVLGSRSSTIHLLLASVVPPLDVLG